MAQCLRARARSLRRGHHFRGGGVVAASRSLHAAVRGAGGDGGTAGRGGGGRAVPAASGRRAIGPCSACNCRAMIVFTDDRDGERGPVAHRLEREVVFDAIEFKCENAKFSCMKRNISRLNRREAAAGSLRRPLGKLLPLCRNVVQFAATARPVRTSAAATRSTSASAAMRASATHCLSSVLRA